MSLKKIAYYLIICTYLLPLYGVERKNKFTTFLCSTCDKKFRNWGVYDVARHIRTHIPFNQCKLCTDDICYTDNICYTNDSLKRHLKREHKEIKNWTSCNVINKKQKRLFDETLEIALQQSIEQNSKKDTFTRSDIEDDLRIISGICLPTELEAVEGLMALTTYNK